MNELGGTRAPAPSALAPERVRASIPWVYVSNATFLVAGAIFYLYLARVLSIDALGSVVLFGAITALFSAGLSLGLGPGFQHFLSYHLGRDGLGTVRTLIRSAFVVAGILGTLVLAVIYGLAPELSRIFFHSGAYAAPIRLLAVYVGLTTASSIISSILVGLQRFVLYSATSMVGYLTLYGLPVVFLAIHRSVTSVVVGWGVGAAIALGLYIVAALRTGREVSLAAAAPPVARADLAMLPGILAYSLPLFVAQLLTTGTTYVDRLVLAYVSTLGSVGIYNYALLVSGGSLFVVMPFSTIMIPRMSEYFGRGDRAALRGVTRVGTSLIILLYVPVALGVAAVGPFVLRILVGPEFVSASLPLAILLIVAAVSIPYVVLTSLAAGIRRTPTLVKATGLALATNVGLSILLIPRFGMVGAALGNASMFWVTCLGLLVQLRGSDFLDFDARSIGGIWLASGVMFAVVAAPLWLFGFTTLRVVGAIVGGVAVLLLALRTSGAVVDETASFLIDVLPRPVRALRPIVCWVARCPRGCHHAAPAGSVGTSDRVP